MNENQNTSTKAHVTGITDRIRGEIAYSLTKRLVIDMTTARAAVDEAADYISQTSAPAGNEIRATQCADKAACTLFPEGFFDDQFEMKRDEDSALQAAAREAGWSLSSLVDEIKFEKRQQVVNIINRLSAALAYNPSPKTKETVE